MKNDNFVLILLATTALSVLYGIKVDSFVLPEFLHEESSAVFLTESIQKVIFSSQDLFSIGTISIFRTSSNLIPAKTHTDIFSYGLASSSCSIPIIINNMAFEFPSSVDFISKLSVPLKIVLSEVHSKNAKDFIRRFVWMIQHNIFDGVFRRDIDHFIFYSLSEIVSQQILLSEIKYLIKFKLCMHVSSTSSRKIQTEFTTISPYISAAENEKSSIIKLKVIDNTQTDTQMTFKLFPDFTWNYYGYPLKMAISGLYKPIYEVAVGPTGEVTPKRGFFMDFSETIFQRLNFTTNKFLCSGYGKHAAGAVTGTRLQNGTWVGCMGDVISGKAEISVAAPDMNRYGQVAFLPRFEYVSIAFVTRPARVIISWKAIYKAFTLPTWILSGLFLVCLAFVIWSGNKVTRLEFQKQSDLGQVVFQIMRIALYQGNPIKENIGLGGKLGLTVWLQRSWILATAYTSKLTSLLTIPVPETHIPDTFSGLEESSYFTWGAPKLFRYGIGGEIFKISKSPVMQNLHSKMKMDNDGISCLRRAQRQDYACISWNFLLDFDQAVVFDDGSGRRRFQASTEVTNFIPLTQIMQRGSVFQKSFGYFAENIYEMGFTKKWAELDKMKLRLKRRVGDKPGEGVNFLNTTEEHKKKDSDQPESLKLINFQGSFGIFAVGVFGSLILLLIECRADKRFMQPLANMYYLRGNWFRLK